MNPPTPLPALRAAAARRCCPQAICARTLSVALVSFVDIVLLMVDLFVVLAVLMSSCALSAGGDCVRSSGTVAASCMVRRARGTPVNDQGTLRVCGMILSGQAPNASYLVHVPMVGGEIENCFVGAYNCVTEVQIR